MTSSFSVRFKLNSPPSAPAAMRLGLMWAFEPDSRYADPLAKQGTLPEQLPVSAGQATSACLATPPLPRRTRGGVGPLSWNQERPAAPCRRVKNEISYA